MKTGLVLCLCALFTDTLSFTISSETGSMLTCSKFHFEEKVLEKLIRLEHKMEMFSEKMKIWEDSISKQFSKFEEKMDSNDETREKMKIQTKNKFDIFEEQMNNMSQYLASNAQKLSEFKSIQTTLLQDQEKFNNSFIDIVENFQIVSNEKLRESIVHQGKDFSKAVTKNDVIAFSAYRTESQYMINRTIVQFHKVWTNVGNGYKPFTGVFEAPRSGLYHFSSVLMSGDTAVNLRLFVNSSVKSTIYIPGKYGTNSFDVFLRLKKGDDVLIRSAGRCIINSSGSNYITFSGYIIN